MKNGSILCGGVGSGKSVTALAYYYEVCGGSALCDEFVCMGDPPMDLYIITTARKRDTLEWEQDMLPFLLSPNRESNMYTNKIVIDSWNNIQKYTDVKDAFFIFDEQRVVGKGVWVRSFLTITKKNQWILLSATPGDTWEDYIPVFIANGFYKNRTQFNREHVVFSRFTKYPKVEKYLNTGKLIRLRKEILIKMDFERKTISHHIDISAEYDRELYKKIHKDRWNPVKKEPIKNASELCYTLRWCVNKDDSRQKQLLEILEETQRAIVFYNFDYELDILKSLPYGKDVDVAEWNGHKHEPIPDAVKWVYLVQYTAGAEGWNCIKTDTVIFYSQNYSYKIMEQAAGRINRLNTPYTDLYYYHFKSYSGIDLAISRAINSKKNFNERAFAAERR